MEKVKCDCLNHCGDDPWLITGKSYPCEKMLERMTADLIGKINNIKLTVNDEKICLFISISGREYKLLSTIPEIHSVTMERKHLKNVLFPKTDNRCILCEDDGADIFNKMTIYGTCQRCYMELKNMGYSEDMIINRIKFVKNSNIR